MVQMPLSAIGGGSGNDVWGWTDSTTGKEYAIIGLSNGTSFVDITDPAAPTFLGRLPAPPTGACVPSLAPAPLATTFEPLTQMAPDHDECQSPNQDEALLPYVGLAPDHCGSDSQWRDHEVFNDHVYIGSEQGGHGLVVFNLATLRTVTNPPVIFAQTARYCGFGNSHTITVNPQRNFVYANGTGTGICTGGSPVIVNVTNPGLPTFAGCDNAGASPNPYTHDSQCLNYNGPDVAHQGKAICIKSNGSQTNANNRLVISDVTNPAAPVLISSTGYAGAGYTHQGWITARPPLLPARRRARRVRLRPQHPHLHLELHRPRRAGPDGLPRARDPGHRPPAVHPRQLHLPVELPRRAAHPGDQEHRRRAAHRGRVLRRLSRQRQPRVQRHLGELPVLPQRHRGREHDRVRASPGGFFLLRPPFADLAVTVTDAPDPVAVGQNVTYTFTVRNNGPTWSTEHDPHRRAAGVAVVRVRHAVPGHLHGHDDRDCNLGTVPNGGMATVVIVATANAAGTITNAGVASAVETDTRLADNTATAQTTVTQAAQAAEPSALAVDAAGNRVFQPNEGAVVVAPSWRNTGTAAITLHGAASGFTGPAGPTYTTVDGTARLPEP